MPQIPIIMPQLGESIAEAVILSFLVKPGDTVEVDQDLIEVETSKATMNVPSTCRGKVEKFLVKLNESYPVGAVLGYLKMCAHSTLIEELRARKHRQDQSLDMLADSLDAGIDLADSTVATMSAEALWHIVMEELTDETDRLIAELSFKHAYKPGEIYTNHPDRFTCITDVYERKRKIVDRLRRNPEILRLLRVPGSAAFNAMVAPQFER